MSKKMANKILAAVLSLGAVMNNGGISSAMESNKEEKTSNSQRRNEILDDGLRYGKKGMNFVKDNFNIKDFVYMFFLYKANGNLKEFITLNSPDACEAINSAFEKVQDFEAKDAQYTNFLKSLQKMLKAKDPQLRNYIIRKFVDKLIRNMISTNHSCFVRATSDAKSIRKGIKGEVREYANLKKIDKVKTDLKKTDEVKTDKKKLLVKNYDEDNYEAKEFDPEKDDPLKFTLNKMDNMLVNSVNRKHSEGLSNLYKEFIDLRDKMNDEIFERCILNIGTGSDDYDIREKIASMAVVTEDLSFLFRNFSREEIFNVMSTSIDDSGYCTTFIEFIKALYYFRNAVSYSLSLGLEKKYMDKKMAGNVKKCEQDVNVFINHCECQLEQQKLEDEDKEINGAKGTQNQKNEGTGTNEQQNQGPSDKENEIINIEVEGQDKDKDKDKNKNKNINININANEDEFKEKEKESGDEEEFKEKESGDEDD